MQAQKAQKKNSLCSHQKSGWQTVSQVMSRFGAELLSVKKIQLTKLIEWFMESNRKQHFAKERRNRRIMWHEYRWYGRNPAGVFM